MQIATFSDGLYQDSIGIIEKQMEITISIRYTHIYIYTYVLGLYRAWGSQKWRVQGLEDME